MSGQFYLNDLTVEFVLAMLGTEVFEHEGLEELITTLVDFFANNAKRSGLSLGLFGRPGSRITSRTLYWENCDVEYKGTTGKVDISIKHPEYGFLLIVQNGKIITYRHGKWVDRFSAYVETLKEENNLFKEIDF